MRKNKNSVCTQLSDRHSGIQLYRMNSEAELNWSNESFFCLWLTTGVLLTTKPMLWYIFRVEVRTGVIVKKIAQFLAWAEPGPKTAFFSRFWGTLRLSCAQPTGNSFTPNQWYRWKAETLKMCLLLVWRVCDQAFGRYRPLKGAEKWSRDHYENWKFAYGQTYKNSLIPKMLFFSIYDENNEVIAENCFRTVASPGACERLAVLNWRSSSIHPYIVYWLLLSCYPST